MSKYKPIDYAFKSKVLNEHSDLIKQVKRCRLYDSAKRLYNDEGIKSKCLTMEGYYSLNDLALGCYCKDLGDEFKEAVRITWADYKRMERLQARVKTFLLEGACCFVTLTFTDKVLSETTAKERRVLVTRYLKTCNAPYIANIDFGKVNNREHYHALVRTNTISFDKWHKYGGINCERVRNKNINIDNVKLSKYIAKLSNHAIKQTTQRSALIYSR